jgi:hypothetical protein
MFIFREASKHNLKLGDIQSLKSLQIFYTNRDDPLVGLQILNPRIWLILIYVSETTSLAQAWYLDNQSEVTRT